MWNRAKTTAKRMLSPEGYARAVALYRRLRATIRYVPNASLQTIGRHCLTDKHDENHSFAGLSYLDVYERYFRPRRRKDVSVLEIGVRGGASLRTWKSYFHKGAIFGMDIDPGCKALEERRIDIEIGSQDDPQFLSSCFGEEQNFDIIIDDGSHINRMTLASFDYLFYHRLKSGGLYVIEDLRCSYEKLQTEQNILEIWPGMEYNNRDKSFDNERKDIDRFFLDKIRDIDYCIGAVRFVHFWSMLCFIGKV